MEKPGTVGELRASGYRTRSVKQELRDNLLARLKDGKPVFPGIVGYENITNPYEIENSRRAGVGR